MLRAIPAAALLTLAALATLAPAGQAAQEGPCTLGYNAETENHELACGTSPLIGYDCHTTVYAGEPGVTRDHVECASMMQCVTEPCPGSGPIRV